MRYCSKCLPVCVFLQHHCQWGWVQEGQGHHGQPAAQQGDAALSYAADATALPFRFCTVQLPSPANTQADTAHVTSASFFFPASYEVKENKIPDLRKSHFKVGKMQSQESFHERTQDLQKLLHNLQTYRRFIGGGQIYDWCAARWSGPGWRPACDIIQQHDGEERQWLALMHDK